MEFGKHVVYIQYYVYISKRYRKLLSGLFCYPNLVFNPLFGMFDNYEIVQVGEHSRGERRVDSHII